MVRKCPQYVPAIPDTISQRPPGTRSLVCDGQRARLCVVHDGVAAHPISPAHAKLASLTDDTPQDHRAGADLVVPLYFLKWAHVPTAYKTLLGVSCDKHMGVTQRDVMRYIQGHDCFMRPAVVGEHLQPTLTGAGRGFKLLGQTPISAEHGKVQEEPERKRHEARAVEIAAHTTCSL